jgi:four helix bundle protein
LVISKEPGVASVPFEKLRVYQISEALADQVWAIVTDWKPFAQQTVGGQLVRAADSIGANTAEGSGRGTFNDNRRFVRIGRGSLYETRHWLRRAFQRKLLTSAEVECLKPLLEQLAPRLNAYLKSIGRTNDQ